MTPTGIRVLVCGSRYSTEIERGLVDTAISDHDAQRGPFAVVIHGCATGVDHEAKIWAESHGRKACGFRADWNAYGKAAGPIRNQRMLDEGKPDLVIAFPGRRGTADMVSRARRAGVEVIEVKP